MDYLKLTHEKILIDDIMKLVSSKKCGAVSIFVGTTRDNFEDKQVVHLEYEAYDEMALKVMKELCKDIRDKWSEVHNIAIYHRLLDSANTKTELNVAGVTYLEAANATNCLRTVIDALKEYNVEYYNVRGIMTESVRLGVVPVLESSVVIAISSPHRVDSMAAVQYCIENLKEKDFFTHILDLDEKRTEVNSQLVQINASNDEIERRIQNFIERKRQQINVCNVQDFIHSNSSTNCESSLAYDSCARVDAVLIKRKDSKGHLRVMKVKNEWGPQTKVEKIPTLKEPELANTYLRGISERLENAEKHLSIATPIPKDVYDRLKRIEDRILELESLSPEYVSFWGNNKSSNAEGEFGSGEHNVPKKLKYNSDDILKKINAMKHN